MMLRFGLVLSVFLGLLTHARAAELTIKDHLVAAEVAHYVAESMNASLMPQKFREQALKQARPEDRTIVKDLLIRWKGGKDTVVRADYDSLKVLNAKGDVIAVVTPDTSNSSRLFINSRAFEIPEKGSLIKALQTTLGKSSKKSASLWEALVPPAEAQQNADNALAPIYFYTTQLRNGEYSAWPTMEAPLSAEDELQRTGPKAHLTHNSDSAVGSLWAEWRQNNIEITCTPEGANGKAKIDGTVYQFTSRANGEVVFRTSGGSKPALLQSQKTTVAEKTKSLRDLAEGVFSAKKKRNEGFLMLNGALDSVCFDHPRTSKGASSVERLCAGLPRHKSASYKTNNEMTIQYLSSNQGLITSALDEMAAMEFIGSVNYAQACVDSDCKNLAIGDPLALSPENLKALGSLRPLGQACSDEGVRKLLEAVRVDVKNAPKGTAK